MLPKPHSDFPDRVIDSVWVRVDSTAPSACWLWQGFCTKNGYGHVHWRDGGVSTSTQPHRVTWVSVYGPILGGLTIDHICRVRSCCNPFHLRLLTRSANARSNAQAIATHCKRGHVFTEYRRTDGRRSCRVCARARASSVTVTASALAGASNPLEEG